ncbi:hypothetical protein ABTX34_30130 [Streptomyces sp. NPDC096538]
MTALAIAGVLYRPLISPTGVIELAVAHRAEPHLARVIEVIRGLF